MKYAFHLCAIALALACLPFAAQAAGNGTAQKEAETAHAHALMAQSASSLKMAHTHLHHVINCLVGSKGEGFDTNAANPCKGMGNGALPDSASNDKLHAQLETALADAKKGLKDNSLDGTHKQAASAAKSLQAASGTGS